MVLDFINKLKVIGSVFVFFEMKFNGEVVEVNKLLCDILNGVMSFELFVNEVMNSFFVEDKFILESVGFVLKIIEF